MIYLSKGTVQAGSTEKLLFVLYCGQRFELTGETASAWLDGRFDFAEAANRREASVAYLTKLGLAETESANDALSRYRIKRHRQTNGGKKKSAKRCRSIPCTLSMTDGACGH